MRQDYYNADLTASGNCKMSKKERNEILEVLLKEAEAGNTVMNFADMSKVCGRNHVPAEDVKAIARQFIAKCPDYDAVIPMAVDENGQPLKSQASLFCTLIFIDRNSRR